MNKKTALMAAKMLNIASSEFSNHGCNDFELENTPENTIFVKEMYSHLYSTDEKPYISDDGIYVLDTEIMGYCKEMLEQWAAEQL